MKAERGVSTAAVASALVVTALVAVGALAYLRPQTTATTSYSPQAASSVAGKEGPLITYSADAYATEVSALLANFSATTGVPVAPVKSGGATADASAIEAGAPADIFVSVSLAATSPAEMGKASSDWAIGFATDQMVIAYSSSATQPSAASGVVALGKQAATSNATADWNRFFSALVSGTVKVGGSAPAQDPAGVRGWLVLEAAGYLYSGGNTSAYSGALLADRGNVTAASAADLVAPLEAGNLQFLFMYKSAAVSDGLPYVALDPHLNLGDAALAPFYSKFSYSDSAGTTTGSPIVVAVTVPAVAVDTTEALQFVAYVVQDSGSLSVYGLVPLSPGVLYQSATPPAQVQELAAKGVVVDGGALP